MAKMTLLDIVQDILSDMDSDEVNSINDTVEALQVAQIVKTTYFNIIDGRDWPHLYQTFQLTSSSDVNKPTYMTIPDNVIDVSWIKYNKHILNETRDKFQEVGYKTPLEFTNLVDQRNSDHTNIKVLTLDTGVVLNIFNNRAPQYYTSFDNEHIIFDSYNQTVDNALQTVKTQCYGKVYPTFTLEDTFYPDLPIQMFSYLLNEAKSTCFLTLKQMGNAKAEQHAISQRRRMSQDAWKVAGGVTYPHFGRK